jgi:regulator of protease activity HflC (stomatin/prohibitin superfamily)
MDSNTGRNVAVGGIGCLVGLGVLGAAVYGIPMALSYESVSAGQVGVVRHTAPWDTKSVSKILKPGSGSQYVGVWSDVHIYPATQSSYTITDDAKEGDVPGVDVISVPSADGVQMGIQGTLYFTLNTDPATMKEFDDKFGTRSFTYGGESGNAYGGTKGFGIFENAIVRPVINNAVRQAIATKKCSELLASCALVQNTGQQVDLTKVPNGNVNINDVQTAIDTALQNDINATLGGNYFKDIKFTLTKVDVPPNVQDAINQAQTAFANVSKSQAAIAAAQADAKANETRQQGYNACPVCGQIDLLHALPPGVTVFAPGSGTGLPLTGK